MAGRRPKLTKELVKKAISLKSDGMSDKDICIACDVSQSAFYRWQENGGKSDLQKELVEGLKKAESNYKGALLRSIKKQGEKDWRALCWLLERKYPAEYARQDRIQAQVEQTTQATVKCELFFDYGEDETE